MLLSFVIYISCSGLLLAESFFLHTRGPAKNNSGSNPLLNRRRFHTDGENGLNPLYSYITECDDNEFFTHTTTADFVERLNSPRGGKKPRFGVNEKRLPDVPLNPNLKTRYKIQKFPKRQGVTKDGAYKFCSNLRICAGSVRGRKLCIPPIYVRPAMSRVKTSVFNFLDSLSLFSLDKSTSVLDLYCGTGSLGLEALSHGASKCTFVDISLKCLKAVNLNVAKCGFQDKSRIIRSDSIELINSPYLYNINEKFDLMLISPPYQEVVYSELLQYVSECSILNDNAVVVVEYPREIDFLPHVINDRLFGIKNKRYGRTVVAVYTFKPAENRMALVEKATISFIPEGKGKERLKRRLKQPDEDVLII